MFEWIVASGADLRSILVAVGGSIAGAIVGAIIKGVFDRRLQKRLEKLVDEARSDRKAAIRGREDALRERESALGELINVRLKTVRPGEIWKICNGQ